MNRFRIAGLLPLVACAGALATTLPATAQTAPDGPAPAAPAEGPAAEAPAAEQAPAEQGPEASAPPADGSAEVSPEVVDDSLELVDDGEIPEVVVTGFRVSLGAALLRKQRSTGQVDAIVADDIADFPDLNLAESLQRVPGVAITRVNGEGSQITVRGLPGLYTRVRVNGIETRASVGNNMGRNFDFNLFASELFNSVMVHKTASADLDEGSLGAVVDLNTARAFNYKEGFTFVAGATGAYNDLSGTVRPRLTGLVAYRDPGDLWGATASAAYSRARLDVAATETVRWQKSPFNSVNGVICADNPADAGCLDVADAQHPRIPRYGEQVNTGERLGLTAGIQFRPTPLTEVRLDGLFATYDTRTDLKWLEVLFRGNEPSFDITDYQLRTFPDRFGAGNDSLIAAGVDNAWVRSERNRLDSENRFHQLTLGIDQQITDTFRIDALAGTTRSKAGLPHDYTVSYDLRGYNGYRYDFSDDQQPLLAFNGAAVTDPTAFTVSELRDRQSDIRGGFDTVELNARWDLLEELKIAAGVSYKRATLDTKQWNRDGTVCGFDLYDCDSNGDGTDDLAGAPGQVALSEETTFDGDAGAGSTTRWTSPALDGWVDALGYENVPLTQDQDSTYKVTEKILGYYLQSKGEIMLGLGDARLLYDVGVRYVETRQTSAGYNSGVFINLTRPTYRDWLPSANTALWLNDELVVRLAAAKVMARPALGSLSPGGTVSGFEYTVNFQNPNLNPTRATALDAASEWYFADGSMLSLALFWKDIESFPIRESRTGTFASTNLPRAVIAPTSPADMSPNQEGTCGNPAGCWEISQLTDGPGSTVKGLELGFQAPFRAFYGELPVIIRDMGVLANYTFVDSTADYAFSAGNTITERLTGLSNGQYNATLYYDDNKLNARLSLAYRSDYLTDGNAPNRAGNLWEFVEADTRLDFSSSYNVTENLKVSLEALNLTDSPFASQVDVDAHRRVAYNKSGRTYLLGARFTY